MVKKEIDLSRRSFLKKSSVGIAGIIAVPTILSSCARGANDRILIANIGVGSMGNTVLKSWLMPVKSAYNVATCDPFLEGKMLLNMLIPPIRNRA